MAQAKTIRFAGQLLMLGDGATPTEVFAAPCGFTSLNLTVNIETNSTNVPDCLDPDLPAWLESDEVSKQMTVGGSGVIDRDAIQVWRAWLMDGGEKNVRWMTAGTAAEGGGHWEAPGILSTYEETGERGQRWQLNIGITLNGAPTWVDAV
ncbi:phage tail tube protein [Nitratireductor sp. PBL-C9]|uniref:phage tail tube protein n=1 Tax=Nitratireductor sp. PBL-C9 TaxID=3435013 RepID=UPI003D7EFF9A